MSFLPTNARWFNKVWFFGNNAAALCKDNFTTNCEFKAKIVFFSNDARASKSRCLAYDVGGNYTRAWFGKMSKPTNLPTRWTYYLGWDSWKGTLVILQTANQPTYQTIVWALTRGPLTGGGGWTWFFNLLAQLWILCFDTSNGEVIVLQGWHERTFNTIQQQSMFSSTHVSRTNFKCVKSKKN